MSKPSIIIVGGGWAGLSTAIKLQQADYKITVLEGAKQLGGRARTTKMGELAVDNGQHLMLGAYKEMLGLLNTIGVKESDVFMRQPLRLNVKTLDGDSLDLAAPQLPAPIHLLVAFLKCGGISWKEKILGLLSMDRLMKAKINKDISVSQLLKHYSVPVAVQRKLQIPLCIAALNTQPDVASARIFVNVLREAFKTGREASDLLIPIADLGALLPEPAQAYLQKNGANIRLDNRVTGLIIENEQAKGVILANGKRLEADHVVVAGNYPQTIKLFKTQPETMSIATSLSAFQDEPIITLYYQFPKDVKLDFPMLGTLGGYAEWVFDRRIVGQPGLFAVVISASGPHNDLSRAELASDVYLELRKLLGEHLPRPEDVLVLKESKATFSCSVGIDAIRPTNATSVDRLWLAGDYTNTGFPATLEGAVRSGYDCADQIQAQINKHYS